MIEIETHIPGLPPKKVWEYLTGQEHIEKWWRKDVVLQAHKGGNFFEPWKDDRGKPRTSTGRVTALEEHIRLQLDWKDDTWDKPTRVEFLLHLANDGTDVIVQHSGWDAVDERVRSDVVDRYHRGWQDLMGQLRDYSQNQ